MIKFLSQRLAIGTCVVILVYLPLTSTAVSASPSVPGTATSTTSSTYAGYQVDSPPANGWAAASFAVPKVSCTSKKSGVFIGVVIYTNSSFSSSGIEASCKNETASYYTVIYLNGLFSGDIALAAGDHMFVRVTETASSTSYYMSINNGAPGTGGGTVNTGSSPTSALIGMTAVDSRSGVQLLLPHFATVTFGPTNFDQMPPATEGAVGVNMETGGGVLQINTGALKPSGKFWTETFKHS